MNGHGRRLRPCEHTCTAAANRWGHGCLIRAWFSAVSRIGDGALWYALKARVVLLYGYWCPIASARMATTGAIALMIYKALQPWTRRPRPYARGSSMRAPVAPLDEFSLPQATPCTRCHSPGWHCPTIPRLTACCCHLLPSLPCHE